MRKATTSRMDAAITPEERAALAGPREALPAPAVEARDFRHPRRLAPEHAARIKRVAQRVQLELENQLQAAARGKSKAEIVAVTESSVPEILDSLSEPFCLLIYETGGQTSWTVLDMSFAVALAERMLGAPQGLSGARRLTSVEIGLIRSLVTRAAQTVLQVLGTEPKNPRFVQDREALHLAQELSPKADPQRLSIQVALSTSFADGMLRIYTSATPAVVEPVAPAPAPAKTKPALPATLADAEVELRAELDCVDIPLDAVLALEVGDVIPLTVQPGEPIRICIEDDCYGKARWGELDGKLALRVSEWNKRS